MQPFNGSAPVTQLDIATHRLQPDLRLTGAWLAARAIQPLPGTVLGHPLGLPAHAAPDVAAERADFVVQGAFGHCADGQVATDRLRFQVRPRRQFPLESEITGGAAYPYVACGVIQPDIHIATDGGGLQITARAVDPDGPADRTDMYSRGTGLLAPPAQHDISADSLDLR